MYLYVGWRESDQQYMVVDAQCALHACHGLVVSSWPRLQNGDKMLCVEPLDGIQIAGIVATQKRIVNRLNRILSVTPGLAWFLYVFLSISSAPSRPPASSSIINHRSSRYITTIYHNHVCHYNRHLIVSTLGLYAPGSAFRFQAHSPSLQQVCGQDSPRFVEADAFLFCCVKNMNISIVQL